MSKFINVEVTAKVSTEFMLEVDDEATDEEIQELAKKEVTIPTEYPSYINKLLTNKLGINIEGIDSLLKGWNTDEIKYKIQ
jgi:ATP phosphoribosyltransferase